MLEMEKQKAELEKYILELQLEVVEQAAAAHGGGSVSQDKHNNSTNNDNVLDGTNAADASPGDSKDDTVEQSQLHGKDSAGSGVAATDAKCSNPAEVSGTRNSSDMIKAVRGLEDE